MSKIINMLIAQNLDQIQTGAFPSMPLSTTTPASIIGLILPYIFGAAAIALLVYLVLGGLQMMTSQGEPKAMQGAQAKITNALLGFVIIIVAFFIVELVGNLLDIGAFGSIFK